MIADGLRAYADVLRPLEELSPSEWAARHRVVRGGPFPGQWDNTNGPYLVDWMDVVAEARREGKIGVVGMKSAQGAGTEALGINALAWLLTYAPGPYLYLTAKDDVASELSRDRWAPLLETCAPLKKKHLPGKAHGEKIQVKRFIDGKLVLAGSRSPNNYIANPFRGFVLDEHDSVVDVFPDGRDPLTQLLERLAAWAEAGPTVGISLAHPTRKDRGAGKLYYESSDQRRGHVECPHCAKWVAPRWEHVRSLAREGQSPAQAERDPTTYVFVAPCCGVAWSEGDRLKAIRHVQQRSTLPPEIAKEKRWIGVHFWRFFLRTTGSVVHMATQYIEALDDPGKMRVFVNMILGDVFEEQERDLTVELWEPLAIAEGSEGSFGRGKLPFEVQWLTAGQDSKETELHWLVAGWGFVRSAENVPLLCGWVIDAGVLPGPRAHDSKRTTLDGSDLFVFDQILYEAFWPRVDGKTQLPLAMAFHDSGWQPNAAYEYCRTKRGRGFPSKGGSYDDYSKAPAISWGGPPRWRVGTVDVSDPHLNLARLNTYRLKSDLAGLAELSFKDAKGSRRSRLVLPHDVRTILDTDERHSILDHFASERLVRERGRRRWVRRAANHWFDALIMAYAAALNIAAGLQTQAPPATQAEAQRVQQTQRRRPPPRPPRSPIRTKY